MAAWVTGEAVALELRPARLPSRALALMLDLALALTTYVVVAVLVLVATASLDEAARAAVSLATFVSVMVGGPVAVETLSRGRSLGKLACGLRVVRDDGGPIAFRHALVRGLLAVVEILMTLGLVACVASLVSARGRRLGDVFAGTLVVRERVPAGPVAFVPPPPPGSERLFTGLDLSAVPDDLWLAVRQCLTRAGELDPRVGAAMAARLASDVAALTGVAAPPGMPPMAYLAGVSHERRAREVRRAHLSGSPSQRVPGEGVGHPAPPRHRAEGPAPHGTTHDPAGPAPASASNREGFFAHPPATGPVDSPEPPEGGAPSPGTRFSPPG
ncbi:RDD family protein [Streptomyces sp. HSG2]|uniref:RDD family protein n=1 Tax=Streptomyces sp. HSG2 TaxID=2797167 RepID=UPI001908D385|nr:RDD family protein [Streptomyces sp. HSG2]